MQRTTIRLNEHLLARAKEYAARERRSLTSVIEDALHLHIARGTSAAPAKSRRAKFPTFKGNGYQPGIKTWDDVKRVLEKEEIENFKRVTREDAASRR